eukprot:8154489-Alexandrium_andersonii.AAC.1
MASRMTHQQCPSVSHECLCVRLHVVIATFGQQDLAWPCPSQHDRANANATAIVPMHMSANATAF